MLVLVDRRHATRPAGAIPRALALERMHVPFVSQLVAYPKTVALLAVALTVVSAWGLRYVQFDYNLLNLQGVGTESVILGETHPGDRGALGFNRACQRRVARRASAQAGRVPRAGERLRSGLGAPAHPG